MSDSTSDHDLLFGLLALQNGLINQGLQLVAAFQAWTLYKDMPWPTTLFRTRRP